MTDTPDKIISAIQEGTLKMRPRWHFFLKAALGVLAMILAGGVLFFVTSLLIFSLRVGPGMPPPGAPFFGLIFFVHALPWTLIILSLSLVALVEYLLRRYEFGYRKPVVYTLLAILSLTLVMDVALQRARAHDRFYRFVEERHVPVMGPVYRHFAPSSSRGETFRIIIK